jgi:RIO kinase 3
VFLPSCSGELNGHPIPEEVALKVFKTTLSDFKNRADYVKGDVRFFKDEFKKQNPRKIMKIWAQKEEFNLRRYFGIFY